MFQLPTPPTNTHASHTAINQTNIKDRASPFCAPWKDFGIYGTCHTEHLQLQEKLVTVTDYYHTNSQIPFEASAETLTPGSTPVHGAFAINFFHLTF